MPFAQQNETETKLKRNSFKTVSFQFYFSSISLCGGIRVYCVVLSLRTLNISLYRLFLSVSIYKVAQKLATMELSLTRITPVNEDRFFHQI